MKRTWRVVLPLVWMGIIFFFSSIPNLELTGQLSIYDLFLRKLAHVTEYAILAVLWWYALGLKNSNKRIVIAFFITFLYALSDELHQHFVPTRDGKLTDVAIDTIGILLGLVITQNKYFKDSLQ